MRRFSSALFLCIFSIAPPAQAAVFERDWQAPGDGLLTYDNVNRREWLDLSLSILDQFPGTTFEEKFENAKLETLPGGMFEGFTVAKSADATALALSAGIDISTGDFDVNYLPTLHIIDLLDVTLTVTPLRFGSFGAIDEKQLFAGTLRTVVASFSIDDRRDAGFVSGAGFSLDPRGELVNPLTSGVMLLRPAIPEPSSMCLFISGLIALSCTTRKPRS